MFKRFLIQKTKANLIFLPTEVYTYKALAEGYITSDQFMSLAGFLTKKAEGILCPHCNLNPPQV